MHSAVFSGLISRLTPAASSKSAAPDLLETARLPCFATVPPAAATTKILAVEILKVLEPSPPVPTISTAEVEFMITLVDNSRMTLAAAVISSTVSPFMRKPIRKPAICAGVACPVIISDITDCISSPLRFCLSSIFANASVIFMAIIAKGL